MKQQHKLDHTNTFSQLLFDIEQSFKLNKGPHEMFTLS
jgi:hypothetical protein